MKGTNLFSEPVHHDIPPKKISRKEYSSISYDQHEILEAIQVLHLHDLPVQMDATFGYGGFYLDGNYPEFCFDLQNRNDKNPNLQIASAAQLPLADRSIRSANLDPPFVVTSHVKSEEYIMGQKYGGYATITELRRSYFDMMIEHYLVLQRGGILTFKCQDFIHGKKAYFINHEIFDYAKQMGFKAVDQFILLSKNRFSGNVHKQQHARKFHCYFWVFQK